MSWADSALGKIKVRTNSETPVDTKAARDFGAVKVLDSAERNICFLTKIE